MAVRLDKLTYKAQEGYFFTITGIKGIINNRNLESGFANTLGGIIYLF